MSLTRCASLVLLAAVLMLGCASNGGHVDPVNATRALPQIQSYLAEHPNPKITVALLTGDQLSAKLAEYPACASIKNIKNQSLYFVSFEENQATAIVLLEPSTGQPLCIISNNPVPTQNPPTPVATTIAPSPTKPTATPTATPSPTPAPAVNPVRCTAIQRATTACTVDFSAAPNLADEAQKAAETCEDNAAKIKRKMQSDNHEIIQIKFQQGMQYAGQTTGNLIELSAAYFARQPDDLGAIVHEMAHVYQGYPSGQPSWLTEGIADYIRYWAGYNNSWSYAHCAAALPNYTSGYWCSAAFLQFVEEKYDSNLIPQLNAALRQNKYDDKLFQEYAGKPVDQLWQECRQNNCKTTS